MNNTDVSQGYVVLGPYRSGTSLTSVILSRLGIEFGANKDMYAGTKFNPYGYYERIDINDINTQIITSAGYTLSDPGNPVEIINKCDHVLADRLWFDWMRGGVPWGIKDPRMCATLLAWIKLGVIDPDKLGIIHVKRSLDAATASGMNDPNIPRYCDGTKAGVRRMLEKYNEMAEWHVRQLRVPSFTLHYEELIKDPDGVIGQLANFVCVDSKRKIRTAIKLVGKGRALRYYYLNRLFIRAPKKLARLITGKEMLF